MSLAIGDATGHGMKAGLMVSIIKSLFIAHLWGNGHIEFPSKSQGPCGR